MAHSTRPPPASHNDPAVAATHAMFGQIRPAVAHMVERLTPWLVDVGNWVFAGLIAFILVVLAPLLMAGSGDPAITLATGALSGRRAYGRASGRGNHLGGRHHRRHFLAHGRACRVSR